MNVKAGPNWESLKGERRTKSVPFKVKEFDEDAGTFAGYASVFDVEDSYGDVVERGAFARTLDHWAAKGAPIPILYQHSPYEPIGITTSAKEDDRGLYVEGKLLLELDRAKETRVLMNAKVLGGLSIGYSIINAMWDKVSEVLRLTELRLYEWSPVTWPANEATAYTPVKSLATSTDPDVVLYMVTKAARELSGEVDQELLCKAIDLLSALREPTDEADSGDHSAEDQEPPVLASGDEPPSVDVDIATSFAGILLNLREFAATRR